MSISGDRIRAVLRIEGQEAHTLSLHPSLLPGPFRIEDRTYQVERQEIVRRGVEQIAPKTVMIKSFVGDREETPVLSYETVTIQDWIVILDLVEQAP